MSKQDEKEKNTEKAKEEEVKEEEGVQCCLRLHRFLRKVVSCEGLNASGRSTCVAFSGRWAKTRRMSVLGVQWRWRSEIRAGNRIEMEEKEEKDKIPEEVHMIMMKKEIALRRKSLS